MALILCPECGREISDKAVFCPGCGYPMRQVKEPEKDEQSIIKPVLEELPENNEPPVKKDPSSAKMAEHINFTDMNDIEVKLENGILTIADRNGEEVCSDQLSNYYLVYYKAFAPALGKIRWEVVVANDNATSPIYLVAEKGETNYKKLRSLCKILNTYSIVDTVETRKEAFEYATSKQERTGEFEPLKFKKKINYCLLVSFVLGVAYSLYILTYFFTYKTANEWESLGVGIAMYLLTPHIVCTALATIFNGLGLFLNKKGLALTGAILFSVAILLFPIYWMFVIIQALLSFIGFGLMCKANKK